MTDVAQEPGPGHRAAGPPAEMPAGVRRRVEGLLGDITAEDGAVPSVRWLTGPSGLPQPGADVAPSADVVIAHDVLPHAEDPAAAVAGLMAGSRRHLLVSAPREPLAHLGVTLAGRLLGGARRQRFSTPDLLRLASTAGALRATCLPWPWTLLWVRRT